MIIQDNSDKRLTISKQSSKGKFAIEALNRLSANHSDL